MLHVVLNFSSDNGFQDLYVKNLLSAHYGHIVVKFAKHENSEKDFFRIALVHSAILTQVE